MATRAVHIVIDAADPSRLAAFWAAVLGWEVVSDEPGEAVIAPAGFSYPDPAVLPLVFVPVAGPKTGKNRVHLDLSTTSDEHQAAEVERLLALGATSADIGQGDVPWEVLADLEGNEFCVLDPRPGYLDARPIAAVVIDSHDPAQIALFWAAATGWKEEKSVPGFVSLRAAGGTGPFLELLRTPDTKTVKNRIHVDVAPLPGGDTQAEAHRLEEAGAVPVDIGQGDVSWVVLADPGCTEFCVLTPR
jgi:catechol 2,3-dioxygenase-like lactoylglutathione lyase family enzyme